MKARKAITLLMGGVWGHVHVTSLALRQSPALLPTEMPLESWGNAWLLSHFFSSAMMGCEGSGGLSASQVSM